jgi:hypothetical protein
VATGCHDAPRRRQIRLPAPVELAALAYYAGEVDYDLPHAERLARESIASRPDEPLPDEPANLSAEIALWFGALIRGDLDDALRWAASNAERGRRRGILGDIVFGFGYQALAWSFHGRFEEARSAADELSRHLGKDPAPMPAWALLFSLGHSFVTDDPDRAVRYFHQSNDAAAAAGVPFMCHLANRDAMGVVLARLSTGEAAAAACNVVADMWGDRDVFNIRIAVAHSTILCARAGRFTEAAFIDGWLGSDVIPVAPQYAEELDNTRHEIDARLGTAAADLRSQGASRTADTLIEFLLTTLWSIADEAERSDLPASRTRPSPPLQPSALQSRPAETIRHPSSG